MTPWDRNARRRLQQIESGMDLSYLHVLIPAVVEALPQPSPQAKRLLDAGCGPGVLANELAHRGWSVMGVDTSEEMIRIAKETTPNGQVEFAVSSLAQLSEHIGTGRFDAAVANMALTGTRNLAPELVGLRRCLKDGGIFITTDVHPWFWREYKEHADISYWDEVLLEERLTISLDPDPLPAPTPVVYRSLENLTRQFRNAGFIIEQVRELRPLPEVESRYPRPWKYPRFILFRLLAAIPL